MFLSLDQPRVFLVCLLCGVFVGLYYEIFYLLKKFIVNNTLKNSLNVIWLASSSVIYTAFSVKFELPDFRLYLFLAVIVGILLYKFSFHKVFAIFTNRVYNITNKINLKIKGKKFKHERRK